MIHLIDNYYTKSEIYGYQLVKDTGRKDKDGNPVYTPMGYCGDLIETARLLHNKLIQDNLPDGCIELSEALSIMREQRERIENAIRKEVGEIFEQSND